MKKQLLFTIFSILVFMGMFQSSIYAQKWIGGGDGTSWNDPANWDTGEVPGENALLKISKDAVITGEVPHNPGQFKIQKNINVTFDLDITFGDGVIAEHAITIAAGSTLTLGSEGNNRTIAINIAPNKQCIAAWAANDGATLNIMEGTTLHVVQGQFGVNLSPADAVMNNYGTILIGSAMTTGLKTAGTYNNFGVIDGTNAGNNGIITAAGGTFINHESGVINITASTDDCVELEEGSTFMNHGQLNVNKGPEAGYNNSAIAIAGDAATSTFVHDSEFPLNITGTSDSSYVFVIDTMGMFENHGVVNFNGVNRDSSVLVQGTFMNAGQAWFNINSGHMAVGETGTFTNDWVVTQADAGSVFTVLGTATNNGFFDYASGADFAEGTGTITDNGLPFMTTIDAGGECTVDLANVSLEWFEDGTSIGTSDETGALTFAESSLANNPTVLTTTIDGVSVTVENYCPEAWLDPSNVFGWEQKMNVLEVYPNLVAEGTLNIDLSYMSAQPVQIRIMDRTGQVHSSSQQLGGQKIQLSLENMTPGMYVVHATQGNDTRYARFVIIR